MAANIASGATELNSPVFRAVLQRVPGHAGLDAADVAAVAGVLRVGDDALRRHRLVHESVRARTLLRRHRRRRLQQAEALQRRGGGELDLAPVPGHRTSKSVPRALLPTDRGPPKFHLYYSKLGDDGKLHTSPVQRARDAVGRARPDHGHRGDEEALPDLVQAARSSASTRHGRAGAGGDPADPGLPAYRQATHRLVRTSADDSDGNTVLGFSSIPARGYHNVENLDLEPRLALQPNRRPSPLFELARTTYGSRLFRNGQLLDLRPLDAARLDLASEVAATLKASASAAGRSSRAGIAAWKTGNLQEPYDEHSGVTALADQRGARHRLRRPVEDRSRRSRRAGTWKAPSPSSTAPSCTSRSRAARSPPR